MTILMFTGCAGGPTKGSNASPKKEVVPLVGSFSVHRYTYDNGLKLLVVEDHTSPTFAYNTWFKVGSKDEIKGYTGLAHLFEHMMFKGTKNHPEGEFDRILEAAGAEGENAFTSNDYTAYIQELPKNQLELIARLESDRMVNLIVNDQSFKTEREVVQNERRMRNENSPSGLMYQELFGTAFTRHAYHWPVIGYEEDLNRMTAEDAVKFYKNFYTPNNATIVVSGDVDPEQVYSVIDKYYGHIKTKPVVRQASETEPEQKSPRRKKLKLNIQVERMVLSYHISNVLDESTPALAVLQNVLAGGKSSRLHRALVNTGIASNVGIDNQEAKDPSLFSIWVTLQKGKKTSQAETIVLKEIERITKAPVNVNELERAKNQLTFQFNEGLNSNNGRTGFLGAYESIAGDFEVGIKMHTKIQSVTAEDVQQAAARFLKPSGRTVITGVPK